MRVMSAMFISETSSNKQYKSRIFIAKYQLNANNLSKVKPQNSPVSMVTKLSVAALNIKPTS